MITKQHAPKLLSALERAWERTDRLFATVRPEALHERPIPLRNPLAFYVGHLPAFAWNMICDHGLGWESSDPALDRLLAFGIDPEDVDEITEDLRLPPLATILAYRDRVRSAIRDGAPQLAQRADRVPLAADGRLLHLVSEHELMHHETLLYMFQELDRRHQVIPEGWPEPVFGSAPAPTRQVRIPAGEAVLGAAFDAFPFGLDNEYPERRVQLPAFALDSLPVTIGDYLSFVRDGGYAAEELWDEASWSWLRDTGLDQPKNWVGEDGGRVVRTLFEDVPLERVRAWPVCVSWAEASAYARWRGGRLPTEPELFRAAYVTPRGEPLPYPWGAAEPTGEHGNFGFTRGAPIPVGSCPRGSSPWGIQELVGNGWEWTATPFAAHEGFEAFMDCYPGYSADFFDGRHYAAFGASWATDNKLLRRSFRNWFRFNYPYPFTKFRLAWDP